LHDTWDLNGLRRVLRGIESGDIGVTYRETHGPSPFAGSLVWEFGLAFGEAGDAPRGECRAAYLALNRDLLRETLEAENLRQLLEASQLSCGEFRPDGSELEYCAPLVLARLHRESLRRARQQVAPVERDRFAAFLPRWHGIGQESSGRQALAALLHLPLTREQW